MTNANVSDLAPGKFRFRAKVCFAGYRGCEIEYVPTNGRQYRCASCAREADRGNHLTPASLASKRRWRRENRDRENAYHRRAWQPRTTRLTVAQRHESKLLMRHRLSLAGKAAILREDGGICLVCGDPVSVLTSVVIDHDHACCATGRSCGACIRGVIHQRCNSLMARVESAGLWHPYLASAPDRMARNDRIRREVYNFRVTPADDVFVPWLSGIPKGRQEDPRTMAA